MNFNELKQDKTLIKKSKHFKIVKKLVNKIVNKIVNITINKLIKN